MRSFKEKRGRSLESLAVRLKLRAREFACNLGEDCTPALVMAARTDVARRSIRLHCHCKVKDYGPRIAASFAYAAASVKDAVFGIVGVGGFWERSTRKARNGGIDGCVTLMVKVKEKKEGGAE